MVSAGRIQTLLMCAKAQEMRLILPEGWAPRRLGTRLASMWFTKIDDAIAVS